MTIYGLLLQTTVAKLRRKCRMVCTWNRRRKPERNEVSTRNRKLESDLTFLFALLQRVAGSELQVLLTQSRCIIIIIL